MTKKNSDYSTTIIYKITCKDPSINELYVGHTTDFVKRKYQHKEACNNTTMYNCKLYKVIRENGGWDNWTMEMITFFKCKNLYEAKQKEQQYFISLNATLNSVEPFPNKKEKVEKTIIETENNVTYNCETCKYSTCFKKDFNKHLLTSKHVRLTTNNTSIDCTEKLTQLLVCNVCTKKYKSRVGLWKHRKVCKHDCNDIIVPVETNTVQCYTNTPSDKDIIMTLIQENAKLVKDNHDFKGIVMELLKTSNYR